LTDANSLLRLRLNVGAGLEGDTTSGVVSRTREPSDFRLTFEPDLALILVVPIDFGGAGTMRGTDSFSTTMADSFTKPVRVCTSKLCISITSADACVEPAPTPPVVVVSGFAWDGALDKQRRERGKSLKGYHCLMISRLPGKNPSAGKESG